MCFVLNLMLVQRIRHGLSILDESRLSGDLLSLIYAKIWYSWCSH